MGAIPRRCAGDPEWPRGADKSLPAAVVWGADLVGFDREESAALSVRYQTRWHAHRHLALENLQGSADVILDLWHHLVCLVLGHTTISYGPELWLVLADTGWVPANRAFCRRCHWRGYRTTWGVLVARGQAPAE